MSRFTFYTFPMDGSNLICSGNQGFSFEAGHLWPAEMARPEGVCAGHN